MDLRNGKITVKEILRVPAAKEILVRELPQLMKSPLVNMPLNKVLTYAKGNVPPEKVKSVLEQLKAL